MKTITNFTLALIAMFTLASSVNAQLTIGDFATLDDTFDIEIAQQAGAGLFRANNGNGFDVLAEFGSGQVIGNTFIGLPVISTQEFTDLGDGNFEIQFKVTSGGNLASTIVSGNDITAVRFAIGVGFINAEGVADPLEVLPHEATFAEVATFDQNGNEIAAVNVLGVGAFNDPANDFSAFEGFINVNVAGGAFGGFSAAGELDRVAEARLTILGTIDLPETLLGDVNLDGAVNFLDITPFISLISTNSFQAEGDINLDDVVNFLDISPFISLLGS